MMKLFIIQFLLVSITHCLPKEASINPTETNQTTAPGTIPTPVTNQTTTLSSVSCPDEPGWLQIEESCYLVSVERLTWFGAQHASII